MQGPTKPGRAHTPDRDARITRLSTCPSCHESFEQYVNVRQTHWAFCQRCQIKSLIGANVFATWRDEDDAIWEANERFLDTLTQDVDLNRETESG